MYTELIIFFQAIGLFFLIDWCLEGYYYLRALCARRNLSQYGIGSWALITGSTDGIGLAFAKSLAKYGFNIILVARNPEKLQNVEQELKKYPIQVLSIVKDFSNCTENPSEFFNDIDKQTQHLDVSFVVNNVGIYKPDHYHKIRFKEILNQNALNIWPIVYLSKLFLNRMLKRNKPSGLINISSVAGMSPWSGATVYSSGKSFEDLFTLDLNEEIRYLVGKEKLQNIDILSLKPGFVDTPLLKNVKDLLLLISAEECAENALRVIGKANYSSCHWRHLLMAALLKNQPAYIIAKTTLKGILASRKNN